VLDDSVVNGLLYSFTITVGGTSLSLFANGGEFKERGVEGNWKRGIETHVVKITLYLGIEVFLIHKGRTHFL
jgi:hypothetical protein